MTAGSLIQLKYGLADRMAFLTYNPTMTHFKSVYRKHTLFAMETISIQPTRSAPLSADNDVILTFKIGRDADLVKDMFLTFEFPDIYSDDTVQFQWIRRLAEYLVKEVTISIDNNNSIDRHTSEWHTIYSETTLPLAKRDGYYKMIGHIAEYYNPAAMNGGTYPAGNRTTHVPSIIGRKIILPLSFWFNRASTTAFPLIATQRMEFWVTVTLRKMKELFTVISGGYRIRPTSSNVGQFLFDGASATTMNINAVLDVNYIFLDREERKRMAEMSHEYLITQLQRVDATVTAATTTIDISSISKPITHLYILIRRSDLEGVNEWSNYTNWPFSLTSAGAVPPYRTPFINYYGTGPTVNASNIKTYKTDYLLKAARIMIDGQDITNGRVVNFDTVDSSLNGRDSAYFNYMQPYMFRSAIPLDGIYMYSFALNESRNESSDMSMQPAGAINMSSITDKELILTLTEKTATGYANTSYEYHVMIFATNFEIIHIIGGMFGIATAN